MCVYVLLSLSITTGCSPQKVSKLTKYTLEKTLCKGKLDFVGFFGSDGRNCRNHHFTSCFPLNMKLANGKSDVYTALTVFSSKLFLYKVILKSKISQIMGETNKFLKGSKVKSKVQNTSLICQYFCYTFNFGAGPKFHCFWPIFS